MCAGCKGTRVYVHVCLMDVGMCVGVCTCVYIHTINTLCSSGIQVGAASLVYL